ncbi:MAG TPA: PhzF family phenazine biosynthesis protein [Vicinamibacterales bacterium]|nr:PhzF family phenazine biosynthesis protein [Vicinamibacterales bacterium]
MRSYRFLQFDVFTANLFGGNQLAVFTDARGLSPDTMQSVAKEMNFSETTFVLPPETPGTDFRLRIFTPGAELPMAGHPTIGSAFALARIGALERGRESFVFGLGVGATPVSLTWRDGDLSFAWMTQSLPAFSDPIANRANAAAAIGVQDSAVGGTGLPVQVVSCGLPYVLVPLTTRRAVDNAVVNPDLLGTFLHQAGVEECGVFLFSTERATDKATAYSRMFAPTLGVPEDPATGSASGPLGCYLVRHKIVPAARAGAMMSLQGVKMGRPSHVHISIGAEGTEIRSVRVGGEAVLAGEGVLYIP